MLEGGDFLALLTDAGLSAAMTAINDHLVSESGCTEVPLTAVVYGYEGVPDRVPAGPVAIQMANDGQELHEAVVFRINDDVTEPEEELLALEPEEAETRATQVAGAFAVPGQDGATSAELDAGRHAVVCFLPVGATREAFAEAIATGAEPEGPPHFSQGMVAELTVEEAPPGPAQVRR